MTKREPFKQGDNLGVHRSIDPKGVLPQQANRVDCTLPITQNELLINVQSLNIDSASFHQIKEVCQNDIIKIEAHVLELVKSKGKHHNPVTGSGGMLIGTVIQVGPDFNIKEKPVKIGDRVATLVSLTLTPLHIQKIKKIHLDKDRIDIEGHAILFNSGLFGVLPDDIPDAIALAVLDVAGAPAQTQKLVQPGQTVLVVGGGGKSGLLCLFEAKKIQGVTAIALDYQDASLQRVKDLKLADHVIKADARNAVEVMKKIQTITNGKMADLVINVANIPNTEMSCILSTRSKGIVYFFSMSTSFTKAALGAEGVGADIDLRIGNGYTEGHADVALNIMRESPSLRKLFESNYC